MCNPPFFISEFEASHGSARSEKRPQPTGVCTGAQTETVTGGGEVEFVKELIKDSLILKEQIRCISPNAWQFFSSHLTYCSGSILKEMSFLSLVSGYLFAIRSTRERTKEKRKSYYLDSHGKEAQKKPVVL